MTNFDFEFTKILGWSVSRYNMFQTCKRQYYYNYYGKYDTEYPTSEINKLKNLTSIPLMRGTIVHHVLETLLKRLKVTEKNIDKNKFFQYAKKECRKKSNNLAFTEVYYGDQSSVSASELYEDVSTCLKNFIESDRFPWVMEEAVKYKDNWIIEPPNFGETRIDDIKAYTKFDFLTPLDDKVMIIDWKSGIPDENKDRKQLMGYTSWACYHLKKDPQKIVAVLSYLKPEYSETIIPMDDFDFRSFYRQVKKETYEMRDYCKNATENIPKEKEIFMKTSNEFLCQYCNFRDLCKGDKLI